MTRRDYIIIAGALNQARKVAIDRSEVDGVEVAASWVADALKKDNGRFDLGRFMAAVVNGDGLKRDTLIAQRTRRFSQNGGRDTCHD
jgi:hypothetical protein